MKKTLSVVFVAASVAVAPAAGSRRCALFVQTIAEIQDPPFWMAPRRLDSRRFRLASIVPEDGDYHQRERKAAEDPAFETDGHTDHRG